MEAHHHHFLTQEVFTQHSNMYGGIIYGCHTFGGSLFVVRAGTFSRIQLRISDGDMKILNKDATADRFSIDADIGVLHLDAS